MTHASALFTSGLLLALIGIRLWRMGMAQRAWVTVVLQLSLAVVYWQDRESSLLGFWAMLLVAGGLAVLLIFHHLAPDGSLEKRHEFDSHDSQDQASALSDVEPDSSLEDSSDSDLDD